MALKTDSGWLQIAEQARKRIVGAAHGQRERKLNEVAAHEDIAVAPNTLRRYLAAAESLPAISTATAISSKDVARFPLAVVEALSRWMAFDKASAAKAAKAVLAGDATVREVVAAERQARRAAGAGRWGNSLKTAVRSQVEELLKRRFSEFRLGRGEEFLTEGVDLLFRDEAGSSVAVLIFGPYQDLQTYAQRRFEFAQRLLGLAWVHNKVIAAIPTGEEASLKQVIDQYSLMASRLTQQADELVERRITYLTHRSLDELAGRLRPTISGRRRPF